MKPDTIFSLPYLTRKMLSFEEGTALSLEIKSRATVAQDVIITGFTREGPFNLRHTTLNTSYLKTEDFRIGDFPIMLSVNSDLNTVYQGEIYITVSLLVNGDKMVELCSGYVYQNKGINYPSFQNNDVASEGNMVIVKGLGNAPAGSELSVTPPDQAVWRILGGAFTLVTSNQAGTRRVHFRVSIDSSHYMDFFSGTTQILSLTRNYTLAALGESTLETADTTIIIPIPMPLVVARGETIQTVTENLQTGDDFSSASLLVQQEFAVEDF